MMQALKFGFARLFRLETTFQNYTISDTELLSELAGKRVAIVGNSRALAKTSFGSKIDAADVVIRINRAPMPGAVSHGTRTDWLGLATSVSKPDFARIAPTRVLWMSHKRKRLAYRIARIDGFYLHPLTAWQDLATRLGQPPSTGAMLVELVHRSQAREIDLYGFDFFQSKSLSGGRDAADVPHDYPAEKKFVLDLIGSDPRLNIHN